MDRGFIISYTSKMLRLVLVLIFFVFSSFLQVFAHDTEQDFIVLYNGEEGLPSDVKLSALDGDFFLAEEKAPEVYRKGENLELSSEGHHGSLLENVRWETGELAGTLSGESVTIPLDEIGSFPVTLKAESNGENISHVLLVNVTGKDNFAFPEVRISINGNKIENTDSPTEADLSEEVLLRAETGGKSSYIWNFDNGETKEGQEISYRFAENPYLASPVLRVIDEEGIYQDIQITLKNSAFGEDEAEKNYTPLLIFVLVFLLVCAGLLLKAKSFLKSRV